MADDNDGPAIRVSLRDVYQEVQKLRGELNGLPREVELHAKRLRRIEGWMLALPLTGMTAIAGIVAAVVKR